MAAGLSDFYPVLPVFFVLSLLILILPVWGFIRGRNTPVLFYIAWLFLGNAIYGIDMLIWNGSIIDFAPVYCDIISVLLVMLPIGISCSLLCINILVWKISQSTTLVVIHTKRRFVRDGLVCVGVPFLFAILHILVQNKRFTIIEDVGCMPSTIHALPSLFIYYLPPSIICCCITSALCARSIINFCQTRYRTNSLLPEHAQNAIPFNRYLRLILLCATSFLLIAAFLISMLAQSIQIGFYTTFTGPNATWDFEHVEVISRDQLDTIPYRKALVIVQLLPLPILAFHFFLFFGIGEEAMRNYRACFFAIRNMASGLGSKGSSEGGHSTRMSRIDKPQGIDIYIKGPSPVPYVIPIPPSIYIPSSFLYNRDFFVTEDNRASGRLTPSSAYIVPSPSVHSSRSSVSVSAGHFPYPPAHFFHEHPYAPYAQHEESSYSTISTHGHGYGHGHGRLRVMNPTIDSGLSTNADAEVGADMNTGSSTRSRFSLYSDGLHSPPVPERRFTRVFAWGRRPNHSI